MRKRVDVPPEMAADADACRAAALRLLNLRWRGVRELERRLTMRGFLPETVAPVIEQLRQEKWLDDTRFATELARGRMRAGQGRIRIGRELETKGVDRKLVAGALAAADAEAGERMQLARACARKIAQLASRHGEEWVATSDGRKKIISFLLHRGYEFGAASSAYSTELVRRGIAATTVTAESESSDEMDD